MLGQWGSHTNQFQSIVFIGLRFDIAPFPRIFVGGADEGFEAEGLCQIVDLTGGAACFHDDKVRFVFLEDCVEVVSIGGSVKELVLSSF